MKNFLADRLAWMDDHIFGVCLVDAKTEGGKDAQWEVQPNPASQYLQVNLQAPSSGQIEFDLINVLGQTIALQQELKNTVGVQSFEMDLSGLEIQTGLYFLKVRLDGRLLGVRQVVIVR